MGGLPVLLFCSFLASAVSGHRSPAAERPVSYSGAQVLQVQRHPALRGIADDLNLELWRRNESFVDTLVRRDKVGLFKSSLRAEGIKFSVSINDFQTEIDNENPRFNVGRQNRDHRMNWENYHRLDVIYEYLDFLGRTFPGIVTLSTLGRTHENRPIRMIRISSGRPNARAVFIDGGIHAREWVSPATVTFIIRELVENRNNLPRELQELDFFIVPVLNPDGYEFSHTGDRMWRKNRSRPQGNSQCFGTDLNRNFDHFWGAGQSSPSPCHETFRGTRAASEPETQSLQNFVTSIRSNLRAYVTFHSFGQVILIPYAHQRGALAPGFNRMREVAERASRAMRNSGGEQYTFGNTADVFDPAGGGSEDWVMSRLSPPFAYCIELRDTGNHRFTLPARFILPTAREAFEGLRVIATEASRA